LQELYKNLGGHIDEIKDSVPDKRPLWKAVRSYNRVEKTNA